jgi:RimK family alpha-L-glutamate ligase
LRPGDVALGRLDVLDTLDGVDDGLWVLGELEARGVRVLNGAGTLLATHDKLLTARLLQGAGLPHPRTRHHGRSFSSVPRAWAGPVVVKPRFGSWGRDVVRCESPAQLARHVELIRHRPWFQCHGALIQELVTPHGYDLRIVVAGDRVVGSVMRIASEGEWRTNVALGATRLPTNPPQQAQELALAAAATVNASLVGVDLLPDARGGWTILELNGAVEFTDEYSLGQNVFTAALSELSRIADGGEHGGVARRPAAVT